MPLAPGTRLGSYEIVAPLGAGGMGEVYRARDTRLDRDVALKVLPNLFTSDPDRLARFEREAKVLAALNHPNIAQVYGFEPPSTSSGQAAIAMELVEGRDLSEVISAPNGSNGGRSFSSGDHAGPEGPASMSLDDALAIARQIATALEAAHELGIIHRDLKPANVKVREDGTVKVLDFGLAKAFAADAESAQSGVANSPTLTARSTQLGMILGTAAYMAPEQAKGRPVDRRADVWAFGVVLFEMLAGRRVFDGDDVSDVLASVLKSEPDWTLLPSDLPPPVRRLLRRCLEKDPKKRLRDIAEGMLQLDEGLASGSTSSTMMPAGGLAASGVSAAPQPMWRRTLPILATAAATTIVVAAIAAWRMPAPQPAPVTVRSLFVPDSTARLSGTLNHVDIALSPDGRFLAYTVGGPNHIHLRPLDQLSGVAVRGASGVGPFFSPDAEWIGFVEQQDPAVLKKVSVLGGPQVRLTKAPSNVVGATWTADGIVFGTRTGPLFHVPDAGGEPTALTTLDENTGMHAWPVSIPGTPVILFVMASEGPRGATGGVLAALNRSTGAVVPLKLPGLYPRWAATGHIVFATPDGALRAVAFDPDSLTITGAPVPVGEGIGVKPSGGANFDVSATGHLVSAATGSNNAIRTIVSVDRTGRESPLAAPARNYFYVRASPDGTRLSLDTRDEEQDIWIWDLKRDDLARLTDTPGADSYGLWAPNLHVVFSSAASGRPELYRHRPDGVGQPVQISDTTADKMIPFPNAVTPDGKQVIFRAVAGNEKNDLFIVDMDGDKKARVLLSTEHNELNAALSPTGDYMAFESDLSGGRMEVFVRPFPDVDQGQSKVSTVGGLEPVWSPKGDEIFYVADNQLMTVPVTRAAGGLQIGKPTRLFDVSAYFFGGVGRNYDVDQGGRRFWMVKNPAGQQIQSAPITIVVNWIEELRARVR